jgi:hypothetical protein
MPGRTFQSPGRSGFEVREALLLPAVKPLSHDREARF